MVVTAAVCFAGLAVARHWNLGVQLPMFFLCRESIECAAFDVQGTALTRVAAHFMLLRVFQPPSLTNKHVELVQDLRKPQELQQTILVRL